MGLNVIAGDKTLGIISVALVFVAMISAFVGISGGNLNPAVSVSLGLCNKLPWREVLAYSCAQLLAGIVAAGACRALFGPGGTFDLDPAGSGFELYQAALAEVLY
eukprot:CAMPEP_0179193246 /NCGR_PEP_ID=MMETSP0796-20121207/96027_1 /TAXON_ID=73915 /ORGANISM="Pyrodinium bahamense, Strain pbaha01" /LENGTH=104 /DNA_ID=CAMNT_0020897543 /DNA_START=24 /DNA_END=335 /DNA_ORIENTATION=+